MGIDMTKESNGNVHASVTCENRESTEIDSTNDSNGDMPVIMPCQMLQECTETNITDESSGNVSTAKELLPILCESGEGLPYAPEDFPLPGDKWRWRVGKRVAVSGDYKDRYLYLPKRLQCQDQSLRRPFASKLSVERYIRTTFPNVDVDAFFNSFSWKVPSKNLLSPSGQLQLINSSLMLYTNLLLEHLSHVIQCLVASDKLNFCSSFAFVAMSDEIVGPFGYVHVILG